jgi:hypothetical protein
MPVESFCCETKLNDEVLREVLRLDLAAFLPPKAHEGGFIGTHNHPGVGAANECAALRPSRADL